MHSLGKCCDLEDVFAGRAHSHRLGGPIPQGGGPIPQGGGPLPQGGVSSHPVVHSHRGGGPFYREGLTLEGAGLPGSDLQDIIRAAAGFLDDDVDEVQLGDHGRWQHEGVEIGLAHGA